MFLTVNRIKTRLVFSSYFLIECRKRAIGGQDAISPL